MLECCIFVVEKVGTDPQLFPKMSWAVKSLLNLACASVLGRQHGTWSLVRGTVGIALLPGSEMLLPPREVLMRMLSKSEIGTFWLLEAKSTLISNSELRKMFVNGSVQIS